MKTTMTMTTFKRSLLSLMIASSLSACAVLEEQAPETHELPATTMGPIGQAADLSALNQSDDEAKRGNGHKKQQRFQTLKGSNQGNSTVSLESESIADQLKGDLITLNVNNLPLPAFINEVFGNRLDLSFSLSPELQSKTDLVTLRLAAPQTPKALFNTARNVLADYGVSLRERDGVLAFGTETSVSNDALPLLVTGSALPDVPLSHRPVFQLVPMKIVRSDQMVRWLKDLLSDPDLKIQDDRMGNTVLLRGPVEKVKQAMSAIEIFDRPALKSRESLIITPFYSDPSELNRALLNVLQAEGYDAGDSPTFSGITVMTPKSSDKIVAFASDRSVLNHIRNWVEVLDKQTQKDIKEGLFHYQVKNTQANTVASMLGLLGYKTGGLEDASSDESGKTKKTAKVSGSGELGTAVVDSNRNAIIFRGSGEEWLKLRPLMDELDKPTPSVMIDVLLAEVTLNDKEGLGVDWSNVSTDLLGKDLIMGTANGVGATGLNLTLNSGGQTRAVLNAFYDNKQAVIRSSPKLMVRSGEEASIEVGNEIPVVTGTSQSSEDGNAPINKTVQYRKTGVILSIKPTVQASGVVDLQVSQELSESQDTGTGEELTPTIMNRKVETTLTLRDGGSVMLAGLISNSKGAGEIGVPILGQIPWLGSLFRSKSESNDRTELVIMITPYVIRNFDEAQRLTERYGSELELNTPHQGETVAN
ncbi:secretin N-terminal domain-containing protein [Enterovibrio calviensis]|uniref:secretin N-terminal domain-containing protein n=1 Tax=Enterovibrio calviensis TaxID=91359 RepID=UPI0006879164|nr:secretin N-terminal domain-containing protein [Enterovibrio calviensis]